MSHFRRRSRLTLASPQILFFENVPLVRAVGLGHMKLFVLSLALVAIASCKATDGITNRNSAELSSNRDDKGSGAETRPKEPCLNLNLATARELIELPGIGEVMA